MRPDGPRVMAAIRATWPPGELRRIGPFDVPMDRDGTRRSQAARLRAGEAATDGDLAAIEAARPGGVVGTLVGDALEERLERLEYAPEGACLLMAGPAAPLADPLPHMTGLAHWPPLALCDRLWDETGNGADRRAPMARAPHPKTAVILRAEDRPAGLLFAALDGDCAALHAVATLAHMRRKGVGMLGMRHAARWAAGRGAAWIVLPVETGNAAARGLYEKAGLAGVGAYRYWRAP